MQKPTRVLARLSLPFISLESDFDGAPPFTFRQSYAVMDGEKANEEPCSRALLT